MEEQHPPLTPKQLANRYSVTVETVARWRREGSGPKFKELGPRRVIYPMKAVIEWENTGLLNNTAERQSGN